MLFSLYRRGRKDNRNGITPRTGVFGIFYHRALGGRRPRLDFALAVVIDEYLSSY
jgi:hypothetical protein